MLSSLPLYSSASRFISAPSVLFAELISEIACLYFCSPEMLTSTLTFRDFPAMRCSPLHEVFRKIPPVRDRLVKIYVLRRPAAGAGHRHTRCLALHRPRVCRKQRVQPARIHRFPECPFILMEIEHPYRKIPGEINRRGLTRPVRQFPELSGSVFSSASSALALRAFSFSAIAAGVIARKNMPITSRSRSIAAEKYFFTFRTVHSSSQP